MAYKPLLNLAPSASPASSPACSLFPAVLQMLCTFSSSSNVLCPHSSSDHKAFAHPALLTETLFSDQPFHQINFHSSFISPVTFTSPKQHPPLQTRLDFLPHAPPAPISFPCRPCSSRCLCICCVIIGLRLLIPPGPLGS